ncbi:class I SAM-dependent methyltransferase [Simiduia curdlanivorans]|uniref:Class I SAM-dependent methyltransferase n=1 Tax=Simiduia curdlanivorans TaxID=1492769 RepID=A0ABV8V450_9GAMM|nr:class I SAM-dependent methyltransferase [Simiduia curdlanivorans]MDN3640160.1 class I SAM-dependent methyltransferase [Simiduia curdlanivorans]
MFEPLREKLSLLTDKLSAPKPSKDSSTCSFTDSYRVFHGRGNLYPDLNMVTVDWYAPVLLVTLFKEPAQDWLNNLLLVLAASAKGDNIASVLLQHRYLHDTPTQVVRGELPESCYAQRQGLKFELSLGDRQNVGFFLDMEPGRLWLERRCAGKRVLNLFAFTCAFSVVAEAAGAAFVLNVDMSSSALNRGRKNHRLNNLPLRGVSFLAENILKSWGRIKKSGPYDIVILDPPSFQRGSFVAEKDYAKLLRRLPELLVPGGDVLACLNAPELEVSFLRQQFDAYCPQANFVERLPASGDFPDTDAEKALKLLHFSL